MTTVKQVGRELRVLALVSNRALPFGSFRGGCWPDRAFERIPCVRQDGLFDHPPQKTGRQSSIVARSCRASESACRRRSRILRHSMSCSASWTSIPGSSPHSRRRRARPRSLALSTSAAAVCVRRVRVVQCARWRVMPACNIFGTILPEKKISGHTPEFRELAISENGRHCLLVTSKAMACAALELLRNPELLAAAREELAERLAGE